MLRIKRHMACAAALAALFAITACAPLKTPPTSYVERSVPASEQGKLASQAAQKMAEIWLPAKTSLVIPFAVDPEDAFGNSLIDEMRRKGYAVIECYEYRPVEETKKAQEANVKTIPLAEAEVESTKKAMKAVEVIRTTDALAQGKALNWAVTPLEVCIAGKPCLYRMTVSVDGRRLSRPYLAVDGALSAAGAWTLEGANG